MARHKDLFDEKKTENTLEELLQLRDLFRRNAATQSQRGSGTPPTIPSRAPYEVQEEPSRLEVEPLVLSNKAPLPGRNTQSAPSKLQKKLPRLDVLNGVLLPRPGRNTQSVPYTSTTASRLAVHENASPSQTVTLKPVCLGVADYIVPLAMDPRITHQYITTIKGYRPSIQAMLTEEMISQETENKLSSLLTKLGRIATHTDLTGGGPSSHEEVDAGKEAAYAEISSEKFRFLGHLFALLKDKDMHICLVARGREERKIITTFLAAREIIYEREARLEYEAEQSKYNKLAVTVITRGHTLEKTVKRKPNLVITLDGGFNAILQELIESLWKPGTYSGAPPPVIRLVVTNSVEHLDLCLPRSLAPNDRFRRLVYHTYSTQNIIGQTGPDDDSTQAYAEKISTYLLALDGHSPWIFSQLLINRPIEYIPIMDSDSSLSDAMSETGLEQLEIQTARYSPNPSLSGTGDPGSSHVSRGKRPVVSIYLSCMHASSHLTHYRVLIMATA